MFVQREGVRTSEASSHRSDQKKQLELSGGLRRFVSELASVNGESFLFDV